MGKNICVYHANCVDGFTAAWVVYQALKEEGIVFHPGIYSKPPPALCEFEGRNVYLVDFSYDEDIVREICSVAKRVVILDHHKTAVDKLSHLTADNLECVFDMERSGATITWDYFFPDDYTPNLLRYVEDYDLWRFRYGSTTKDFVAGLYSYPQDFETWTKLMDSGSIPRVAKEGAAIRRSDEKRINEFARNVVYRKVLGRIVPTLNIPYFFASKAGDFLCSGDARLVVEPHFVALYYEGGDQLHVSLRSRGEQGADCAKIAEHFGGGGHKNAAGFRVPLSEGWATIAKRP